MHGGALLFMVTFWGLVLGLVTFVFCRLYCPSGEKKVLKPSKGQVFEEPEEVT